MKILRFLLVAASCASLLSFYEENRLKANEDSTAEVTTAVIDSHASEDSISTIYLYKTDTSVNIASLHPEHDY